MRTVRQTLIALMALTVLAVFIALPREIPVKLSLGDTKIDQTISIPNLDFYFFGKHLYSEFPLKKGLDIQGGMQVILAADMSKIPAADQATAIEAAKSVITRRVDLYGISEPVIQTSKVGSDHRIIVELPGVSDTEQALALVGKTADLDFRLESSQTAEATVSAMMYIGSFKSTGLTGKQLKKASYDLDPNTAQPVVNLKFDDEGSKIFANLTANNVGKVMGIFVDGIPVTMPRISTPILDGQAIITGDFTVDTAKQMAIQLNAGALPIPITVLEQKTIGASLGETSVNQSVRAGLIGLSVVVIFMILIYGFKGFVATIALLIYAALTIAIYKIMGVTLSLPGIAGLLLSIGMAVDANILIFERMKEELRVGQPLERAMELGFGRAWDSIKDANLATIMTSLVLINPLDFTFLNSSGLVRGFGITLLIGVLISLFTGVVVSRTLLRILLPLTMKGKQV